MLHDGRDTVVFYCCAPLLDRAELCGCFQFGVRFRKDAFLFSYLPGALGEHLEHRLYKDPFPRLVSVCGAVVVPRVY
jgi:hypothetical protein